MPTKFTQPQPVTKTSSFSQFWEDIKVVSGPYWYPTEPGGRAFSEVIRSWGMLTLLILLIIALVSISAFNSFINRYVVDSLIEDRDYSMFINNLSINIIGLVLATLLVGFYKFVRKQIALDWYKWLNDQVLNKYLSNRAYYKINFVADVDNPDQRISQQIEPITSSALAFSATFLEKILEMIAFLAIIWMISQQVAIFMLVYTIIGNLIVTYLNQELVKINQAQVESKADYSYCLTHVRNNAESIAFFQGEEQELNIIQRRFNKLLEDTQHKISWERGTDIFAKGYQSFIQIFPFLVLAPLYIRDEIDFGQLGQAALSCNMFAFALGELISEFGTSGRFSTYVERLSEFSDALMKVSKKTENVETIEIVEENYLAFEKVTLQTPDYEQVIVKDLSISVQPGEGLLITGLSGRGKSSLLRAIAGLWNSGTGRLVRPPLEGVLFLPQRPYMILGTLREQLLYPNVNLQKSDAELKEVLQQVNLQSLLSRIDNFDEEIPWDNILSLGEKQRLAFARLFVSSPSFTILDEATSALDLQNEGNLYQHLQETKTTYISVGHRESLFNYHQWVLELTQDASWKFLSIQDYQLQKSKEIVTTTHDDNKVVTEDFSDNQFHTEVAIKVIEAATEGLSHKEMQKLTNYALASIRNRASRGKPIIGKDGFTYHYDRNKTLKWLRA